MNILHKALEEALRGVPQHVLGEIISKKFAAQGMNLSAKELRQLQEHLLAGNMDTFKLRHWRWWEREHMVVTFTDEDIRELEQRSTNFLERELPDLIQFAADELSISILARLIKNWRKESKQQQRDFEAFRSHLHDRWGLALERLRMFVTISREFGESVNHNVRGGEQTDQRHLVDVLMHCHARACQVTEEIICLLSNGFPDGAMARWRTLHEIAVVALYISEQGENLAERYVLHQAIESRKAALEYERCRPRLGYEPLDPVELAKIEQAYSAGILRFGASFGTQYGWAAHHLRIDKPSIADIERAVRIDHLRPYYRLASHNVHANPKGVFFKLGLLDESSILLAGPSNAGLADPGHSTALSLMQVSTTLGLLNPTLDHIVTLHILGQLVGDIGDAFMAAHEQLLYDAS